MNAKIGQSEEHKFASHQETNRNGQYLTNVITENGLVCLNTKFQKKQGKLWTHSYPNGTKGQLDYMLVNRKWINNVLNSEAYTALSKVLVLTIELSPPKFVLTFELTNEKQTANLDMTGQCFSTTKTFKINTPSLSRIDLNHFNKKLKIIHRKQPMKTSSSPTVPQQQLVSH